ncbi:MAG: zinc ribbon domain-containing protein [Candidatus Limnocylindria bacterium]
MRPAIGGMPAPRTRAATSMNSSSSLICMRRILPLSEDSVNTERIEESTACRMRCPAGMDEQRTCPSCGEPVGDTDTICPHCGETLVGG